jgi:hypothetical protein
MFHNIETSSARTTDHHQTTRFDDWFGIKDTRDLTNRPLQKPLMQSIIVIDTANGRYRA